jgi:hypothetical protein
VPSADRGKELEELREIGWMKIAAFVVGVAWIGQAAAAVECFGSGASPRTDAVAIQCGRGYGLARAEGIRLADERRYAQASTTVERAARQLRACLHVAIKDAQYNRFVFFPGEDLITAGELAHLAKDTTRGRKLVIEGSAWLDPFGTAVRGDAAA